MSEITRVCVGENGTDADGLGRSDLSGITPMGLGNEDERVGLVHKLGAQYGPAL